MISKKSVIYRFLCIWWVMITMAPRNTSRREKEKQTINGMDQEKKTKKLPLLHYHLNEKM